MKYNVSLLLGLTLGLPAVLSLPSTSSNELQSRNILEDFFGGFTHEVLCGKQNGGKACDANGMFGACCSAHGFCGSTPAHCLVGNGCQSGCTPEAESNTTPKGAAEEPTLGKPEPQKQSAQTQPKQPTSSVHKLAANDAPVTKDGTCGAKNGGTVCGNWPQGSCCSQYGYCGNTEGHCGAGCQSGPCQGGSGDVTTDGTCGATHGNTVCGSWPQGSCCSQYGYCGNTDGHCGTGCQSGPCKGAPAKVTTDGTCGASNNGTICGGWPNGSCCSVYGYCGKDAAHCGDGCQSGACYTAPVTPAPSAKPAPNAANPGKLVVNPSTQNQGHQVQSGVPAMHAGLMPNGKVFFLDKIENYTQLRLPNGQYAYSSEYDPVTHQVTPISYLTNSFCSGGSFLPDGRVISVGGNADLSWLDPTVGSGFNAARTLSRTADGKQDGQGWSEPSNRKLNTNRWYPTAQTMPDGRIFVVSGSLNGLDPTKPGNNNPTWEMLDRNGYQTGSGSVNMTILQKNQPYYMYPFVHVLRDGTVYVAVAKSAQVFSVTGNTGHVVKELPDCPGTYRTYPNTGTSMLLHLSSSNNYEPEIFMCGGGPYQDITAPADPSCGKIAPLSANPTWEMDAMPEGRGMVEGLLLPDGTVILQNGCQTGAQGFGVAKNPAYETLIYNPSAALGQRFSKGPTSGIARLYHSVTLLLLDGTVMIAGSNPVVMPVLKPVPNQNPSEDYVTEFRVETYTPPYLTGANANKRPSNVHISSKSLNPGNKFTVTFNAPAGNKGVKFNLYHGGYVTHSNHMSQRSVFLDATGYKAGATSQTMTVTMPPNHNIVPPTNYVLYVLVDGVPAVGQFVQVL